MQRGLIVPEDDDYKLVERVLHWYNHRVRFSLRPDGSGTTVTDTPGPSA